MTQLTHLAEGQPLVYGGDQVAVVSAELARSFTAGDRLVIVQSTGDLLHIPQAEHAVASAAVSAAVAAFTALSGRSDEQITEFFERFAAGIDDDAAFAAVLEANRTDVEVARSKRRSTTRLALTGAMRVDMAAGLRSWAGSPIRRLRRKPSF